LDIIADGEVVEMDLLSMPGITNTDLTNKILDVCEERADALAIIDLPEGYLPKWENGGSESYGNLNTTISNLDTRQINSSFGACYYPWVVMRDSASDILAVPPSVAAIGALAFSNADAGAVWFAPAGFNRGGIKNLGGSPTKSSGLVVTHTIEHLTKDNRDDLYASNINPIARFPATNQIVIFGQKTLQQTASALDRINVRRLLLFLKRRIGKIADTILFEPNVHTTWNNFKGAADTVLSQVQAGLGITEYKLVLDETTTTADLIDRNVMYAKIFIKPARAIEFIVVDFVVTRSGVEF
jgi:phage tail sheath protein FI